MKAPCSSKLTGYWAIGVMSIIFRSKLLGIGPEKIVCVCPCGSVANKILLKIRLQFGG